MTIGIGIVGKNGIVMATDSRMTSSVPNAGSTVKDHHTKLYDVANLMVVAFATQMAGYESELIKSFRKQRKSVEFSNCVAEFQRICDTGLVESS